MSNFSIKSITFGSIEFDQNCDVSIVSKNIGSDEVFGTAKLTDMTTEFCELFTYDDFIPDDCIEYIEKLRNELVNSLNIVNNYLLTKKG